MSATSPKGGKMLRPSPLSIGRKIIDTTVNNNLERLKKLVERKNRFLPKPDINARTEEGISALMVAVSQENLKMVKYLVEHGADINATDFQGVSVLMRATVKGNLEIVKYLVEHGAQINAKDLHAHSTALFFAINNGQEDVVEYLAENGANIHVIDKSDCTPLHYAAKFGQLKSVKTLVKNGANVNSLIKNPIWNNCTSVLYFAILSGNIDVVKFLTEHGANLYFTDTKGKNALHWTTDFTRSNRSDTHVQIIDYLLEKAPLLIRGKTHTGETPLMIAAANGETNLIMCLLEHGANPDEKDNENKTALDAARIEKHVAAIKLLEQVKNNPYKFYNKPLESKIAKLSAKEVIHSHLFEYAHALGSLQFLFQHLPYQEEVLLYQKTKQKITQQERSPIEMLIRSKRQSLENM